MFWSDLVKVEEDDQISDVGVDRVELEKRGLVYTERELRIIL